jgi:hypothetical protein
MKMNTNRRDFLRSLLAAGALGNLGGEVFAQEKPSGPRRGPNAPAQIRQVVLGLLLDPDTAAGRGMRLGFEEAQRAGQLLHRNFVSGPTSEFALIGLVAPKTDPPGLYLAVGPLGDAAPVRPRVYAVSSSLEFRRQALERHKDRTDLKVVDWHHDLDKFGAQELNERFRRRFNQPMDEAAWRGWVAVKFAAELALRFPGTGAGAGAEKLDELSLDGHKGMPLRFDPKNHHLVQPVYLIDPQGKVVDEVAPEWKE